MKNFLTLLFIAFSLPIMVGAQLTVPQGGTGKTSFPINTWIYADSGGLQRLQSSSTPTVDAITATSSIKTSYFGGLVKIIGNFILPSLSDGCLQLSSSIVTSTGSPCGTGGGSVTSVTGTWPIISSGGNTPNITFGGLSTSSAAVISNIPYFSGVNTFANVATSSLGVGSPLTITGTLGALLGGTNSTINCQTVSGSQAGCLSSTDWNTFNTKLGSYDAFTHPAAGQSATTSLMLLNGNASTTQLSSLDGIYIGRNATTTIVGETTGTSTIQGDLQIGAGAIGNNKVRITADRVFSPSTSVGGLVSIINTNNTGSGLLVYTNNGGTSAGNLVNFRCDNALMAHDCTRIDQDGIGDGLSIIATAAASNALSISNTGVDHTLNSAYTGSTANKGAGNLTSTNSTGSTLQVTGVEDGLGTIKATQTSAGNSASSYVLSMQQNGTHGGLIFGDTVAGSDGKLINIRTNGAEILTQLSTAFLGISSSTPGSMLSLGTTGGINITPTATSTFGSSANGINLVNGCYAIAEVCVGGGGGSGSPGGSATEWQYRAGASTFGAMASAYDLTNFRAGLGTTTMGLGTLTVASTTGPQLTLSSGAGNAQWTMRNAGGNLYIATTTLAGTATSSPTGISILGSSGFVGIGTTTPMVNLDIQPVSQTTPQLRTGTLETQSFSLNNSFIGDNTYYDGGCFRFRAAGEASLFYFNGREGQFRMATTSTAGACASGLGTYAKMKIDAEGSFAVGPYMSQIRGIRTGATFAVTPEGYVGIGNPDPLSKLEIGSSFLNQPIFFAFNNAATIGYQRNNLMVQNSTSGASDVSSGIVLNNNNTTNNTYSPVISFTRTADSGAYITPYANIAGVRTGIGANGDTNWNAGDLTFGTASTTTTGPVEVFRLDSAGRVLVGTTTTTLNRAVIMDASAPQLALSSGAGFSQFVFRNLNGNFALATTSVAGTATSTNSILTVNQNAQVFLPTITTSTSGNALCYLAGNQIVISGGLACNTSSERFKKNIVSMSTTEALNTVLQMSPKFFDRKEPYASHPDGHDVGLIAERVQEIAPVLVGYEADGKTPRSVNYEGYTAYLTGAIQELNTKIDNLPQTASKARNKVEEDWQWYLIGIMGVWIVALQVQIIKKK